MSSTIINEISSSLTGFKWVSPEKANFRCNICGDSKKSKFKQRGWFLNRNGEWVFKCFNCETKYHISKYLEIYFHDHYLKYLLEKKKYKKDEYILIKKPSYFKESEIIKSLLIPIKKSKLVYNYIFEKRKIPKKHENKIFIIKDFSEIKKIEKYENTFFKKEPRIIIPIYDKNGNISAINSRSLKEDSIRYINLNFSGEKNIFGLYNEKGDYLLDLNKTIYVFEGIFDSLFIDNSVAVNCADLTSIKKAFGNLYNDLDIVYCPDSDIRNPSILKIIEEKLVNKNEKVVLLPNYLQGKDINEIILKNKNINIKKIMLENTFSGSIAKLKFINWKKYEERKNSKNFRKYKKRE